MGLFAKTYTTMSSSEIPNNEMKFILTHITSHKKSIASLGLGPCDTPINVDLEEAPHILIGGATRSGKSVCINNVICSLLIKNSPLDLQLYIIDPKKVDYINYKYSKLPHLKGYADDSTGAQLILQNIYNEMMTRYKLMQKQRVDKFEKLNKKMPRILVVFDEFASIMDKQGKKTILPILQELARLGRAAGIHLLLATQRPDRQVIDGQLKANCPTRICFKVQSRIDSNIILDEKGGEELNGCGDGIIKYSDGYKVRFQGTFLKDSEKDFILDHWSKKHQKEIA